MHSIRRATPDDAPWIAAIWNAVIRDTVLTFTTEEKTEAGIAAMIARQPVLVLEDAGGFATYGPFRGSPGYRHTAELSIWLVPSAQGRGGGRSLLGALEDVARAEGMHVLVAGIAGRNAGAQAFHAACGYAQVGVMPQVGRKFDTWQDLVLMQKVL